MPDLSKIFLYRMTHIENIPHILAYGITHADSPNANQNYSPIGDGSIIGARKKILLANGNRLGDYIPFYFGYRMPMLYVIQNGFNGVQATKAQDIVYCVCSVAKMIEHKIDFTYTDGHAVEKFSTFFDPSEVNNIEQQIDRKAIDDQFWNDEKDRDKKRRMEAEFLAINDIPVAAIIGFGVYNETAQRRLIDWGAKEDRVIIKRGYYF